MLYFVVLILKSYLYFTQFKKVKPKAIPKNNGYENQKQVNQTIYQVGINDMGKIHFKWL